MLSNHRRRATQFQQVVTAMQMSHHEASCTKQNISHRESQHRPEWQQRRERCTNEMLVTQLDEVSIQIQMSRIEEIYKNKSIVGKESEHPRECK
jgi:hypothetical protein